MWRLTIKIEGKTSTYYYFEYFSTYEELIDYLATHKARKGRSYDALNIKLFEDQDND